MKPFIKQLAVVGLALMMLFGPGLAEAQATQLNSSPASVSLTLSVSEFVTVSATPASITFTYAAGAATASGPISVTTTYSAAGGRTAIDTVAWFSSTTAALSGPTNIPASQVFASINGGAAAACTLTSINSVVGVGVSGALCPDVFHVTNPTGNATHTDTITLSLPTVGTLAPGTWTGTLNIETALI